MSGEQVLHGWPNFLIRSRGGIVISPISIAEISHHIQCNRPTHITEAKIYIVRSRIVALVWNQTVQPHKWPFIGLRQSQLLVRNTRLSLHNGGLLHIYAGLCNAYDNQTSREINLDPVRPCRGLPVAAGWATVVLSLWVWLTRHGYFYLALIALVAAFVGAYRLMILMGGIISLAP